MVSVEEVGLFINTNILHSESWDDLDETAKEKAVNNATNTLKQFLPRLYPTEIPLFDLSEQVLFIIRKDENMIKAEMGQKGMGVDGISLSYDNISPIAPSILVKYGLTVETLPSQRRRMVGRYTVGNGDTFRMWGV